MYHTTQINERTGSSAGGTRDRDRGLPFPAAGTGTPGAAARRRTAAQAFPCRTCCLLLFLILMGLLTGFRPAVGVAGAGVSEDDPFVVSTWGELATTMDTNEFYSQCENVSGVCYIKLGDTFESGSGPNSALLVPYGANVTLDLNGKTIDRGLTAASDDGYVIKVEGTLTLKDSSNGKGIITGGNNNRTYSGFGGGGVLVRGTFTMKGGTISGNKTIDGGGVFVDQDGSFTMEGGEIHDNEASGKGGGVYVSPSTGSGTTFTMNGGTISDNKAVSGGGVYVYYMNSTFIMNNGTISGNEASQNGGGVYVFGGGTFTMSGGTITGNTANNGRGGGVFVDNGIFTMNDGGTISDNKAASGGGVYVVGPFTMNGGTISGNEANEGGGVSIRSYSKLTISGAPEITGNMNSNVYLNPDSFIIVDGELMNNAPIGVTLSGVTGVFTNTSDGNTNYNDPSRFKSDNPACWVEKDADEQLYIVTTVITPPEAIVLTYTGSAQELVTAGTVQHGVMQYALGTDDQTVPVSGWSGSIPTGTDVGTYYVWYKAIRDDNHGDSAAQGPIKVKIIDPDNTMTLPVEVDNILKRNGARGFPDEISTLEVTLTITVKSGDTVTTTVEPLTLTLDRNSAVLTQDALFDQKITDPGPGKQAVTVSVSPRVVYGRDKIYSSDGPVEGPVKWKYEISAAGEINEKDGKMIVRVYLIWDDGYRPEVIKVYALPEDEIGAYALRADGTKEYLLFHTYGICMQWLGRDELCRGYERCFHKESPYVNPFVKP